MIERSVVITNITGLHARPAAIFVQTAAKYISEIHIIKGDLKVNAKSIMGLMSLAVSKGTTVTISAEGEDEELAVEGLIKLISSSFNDS